MFFVYIVGTAASGKSLLTKSFSEWLEDHQLSVCIVNLDPAVRYLPYEPDVDVRRYVSYEKFLESGLGPNGAMIRAVDEIYNHVEFLRNEVEEYNADYVIVDTPGQIELFAFRKVTTGIIERLSMNDKSTLVYVIDSSVISKGDYDLDPYAFTSLLTLGISVKLRLRLPQSMALNKVDLLSLQQLEKLSRWLEEPESILLDVQGEESGIVSRLIEMLTTHEFGDVITVSALTEEGLDNLYASIQRELYGGEDYST
ncbi:ATP-binding protein [Ignicoccus islandicus DSM 13165]|uniref:ATP-binding protein n=1 Tax=Ignicoccus islandicus DSM 13165 TaxID=940295 RepID=A0A0U3E8B8_9CREN|nr:ATP/GTP-binding protein [Ignicoccus islandicus]ALU11598.1 ATP-binding protein [Ignicoccus islandicus DSM 13165]